MLLKLIPTAVLALLLTGLAPLTARPDAAAGERLARQWCANCHVVGPGDAASPLPQGPPSLRAAAQRLSADELRTWLTHPHGAMPDLGLTRAEIADLIAYIETLK